jgi:hypothetical protein
MNVQQLRDLKLANLNAYRALAAVAMISSYTRTYGSNEARSYRACAFRQSYTAVKAALVGHTCPFWLNQSTLLYFHKHDRKVGMLYNFQRKKAARKAAKRLGIK